MLQFGDTFRYKEKEYVYLARTEDITYAAEILCRETSRELDRIANLQARDPLKTAKLQAPLYCFVMLRTDPFQERAAHIGKAGTGESASGDCAFFEPIKPLSKQDMEALLVEIESGSPVLMLKNLIAGYKAETKQA